MNANPFEICCGSDKAAEKTYLERGTTNDGSGSKRVFESGLSGARDGRKYARRAAAAAGIGKADQRIFCFPRKFKRLLGQIVEREQKQQGRIADYLEAAEEVQQVVEELDNADYRAILHLRYLNFKTWDEIADTLHFSNVWIFHLHKRALSAAGSVIQRREQAACMG